MVAKIFHWAFPLFLIVLALIIGGACYQTISIVPFWQKDILMFKNYGHWGMNYFPLLTPLMIVLWLMLVVTGFKMKLPGKRTLNLGHCLFLLWLGTYAFFAPLLMNYMGHPEKNISETELSAMLATWAKWDLIRQIVGVVMLSVYIYAYRKNGSVIS